MTSDGQGGAGGTHGEVLARVRALTAGIRDGAAAAEEARTVPQETIDRLLAAGITRILIPPQYGGYGLSLDTWFEVVREIGKADASHAWCASLMIHHPHYLSQFPEAAQKAVWADGIDISIAASIQPGPRYAGRRWISGFRRVSVRQWYQPQPMACRRQHGRNGSDVLSDRAERLQN